MRIWLINPPVIRQRPSAVGAVVQSLFYNSPPLGLAYIAAVLERAGHRVRITDCPVEQLTIGDTATLARTFRPQLVGLTSTTSHFDQAAETAKTLHRELPEATICIGGPHFNAHPELLLQNPAIDFGVSGEGEFTLREVVERIEAGQGYDDVHGVAVARDGELHQAPPREMLQNLDLLPLPARHLMPIKAYRPMPNDHHLLPKTSMITSRGCPFHCIFCDKSTFGASYRSLSPERIVEEMHHLADTYGIRDIAFVDSTFTPNKPRIDAVLKAMEADPPRAMWTCSCRANVLDESLLRRMRAMGCWRIRIAIESGNDEILRRIRKGITKEQFAHTVRTAVNLGFQVKSFFMVGHMGETPETIEESIQFALSLPLKDVTVQINTPLKGTPLYDECLKYGHINDAESSSYSFFEPVFVPDGMTAMQLQEAHRSFYRRFYLRPALIWEHVRVMRRPSDFTKYLKAVPLVTNVMFTNRPLG